MNYKCLGETLEMCMSFYVCPYPVPEVRTGKGQAYQSKIWF